MMKITMTILSLILVQMCFKRYWWISTASLLLLIPPSTLWLIQSESLYSISTSSMMDMMSASLIILSILISSMMLLASTKIYHNKDSNPKLFMMLNTSLLLILLTCFASSNIIMFYIWFEASLIPTLAIIMLWGYQPERLQAGMYLMLYTVTASLPMFMIFCAIYSSSDHGLMSMSSELKFPYHSYLSSVFWLMAIGGFLIKLPMFSVHLWLPKAHVEAPIAGSMILAAILLKLGGYGLARMLTMFPTQMPLWMSSLFMSVALWGGVVTSFICMRQPDLKSLIAYSSIGHMGLMLAGMLSNTSWGMMGALAMMIAHGLSSSALFILANLTYEITNTRSIHLTKGMMSITPIMSMWWFLFTAANMAAPPSINLLSEIMLITAILSSSMVAILPVALISFLTAAYSLYMFASTQHGLTSSFTVPMQQMKPKDMLLLLNHFVPIIMLILKPELITSWL